MRVVCNGLIGGPLLPNDLYTVAYFADSFDSYGSTRLNAYFADSFDSYGSTRLNTGIPLKTWPEAPAPMRSGDEGANSDGFGLNL